MIFTTWNKFVFFLFYFSIHVILNSEQIIIEVPSDYDSYDEFNFFYENMKNRNWGFDQPNAKPENEFSIFGCNIAIRRLCPDPKISFYLYTRENPEIPQSIRIGADPNVSNLTDSGFNPKHPTKIIVHGFNSDYREDALVEIREQFLQKGDFNIIAVDWSYWVPGPYSCYIAAVWNTRHGGQCVSQLVERIKEQGTDDIHVIGFSLGAQLPNYMANSLHPYKVPRITGLDPAMPGFVTSNIYHKLDKSDAHFVDVIHTNAFIQGKVEECGHVDFYVNGGVSQPGCWDSNMGYVSCNHNRAPLYFAESINTTVGFWGWHCPSYLDYLLALCPPKDPQTLMGEFVNKTAKGVYITITNSKSPFAIGKFNEAADDILIKYDKYRKHILEKYKDEILDMLDADELVDDYYEYSKEGRFYKAMAKDIFIS